jgi:Mg-chelatase subunit ChlD
MTDSLGVATTVTDTLTVVQPVECVLPTVEPTVAPTDEPTPTPTPTATPGVHSLFLPVTLHEVFCTRPALLDVVLVLDVSSSMLQEVPSKLVRAKKALRAYLERLGSRDQVALVTFAGDASVAQPLTSDTGLVSGALDRVQTGETTRLDLAIEVAHGELVGSRARREATGVMIVLTDGIPNPVPGSVALQKATDAKRAGIYLFTIGLGSDVDRSLLSAMATEPEAYYEAPTADDLVAIYARLADQVPCGPEAYWPRSG